MHVQTDTGPKITGADLAAAESFWATLKVELYDPQLVGHQGGG